MKKRESPPTPDERLDWLLDFVRRDLTTLRPGARLDLHDDMERLLAYRDPAVELASVDPPDGLAFALAKLKGAPDVSWPDSLVLDVQTRLRDGITRLEAGRSWKPLDKAQDVVIEVHADKTLARRYKGGTYAGIMLGAAVDLLVDGWPRLRRCAYTPCHTLFRPKENRQRYHDPKCSKLERWRRLPKATRDYTREEVNRARREQAAKRKTPISKKGRTQR